MQNEPDAGLPLILAFSLSHHFVVWYCADRVHPGKKFIYLQRTLETGRKETGSGKSKSGNGSLSKEEKESGRAVRWERVKHIIIPMCETSISSNCIPKPPEKSLAKGSASLHVQEWILARRGPAARAPFRGRSCGQLLGAGSSISARELKHLRLA